MDEAATNVSHFLTSSYASLGYAGEEQAPLSE